jgi:hypothetical protein
MNMARTSIDSANDDIKRLQAAPSKGKSMITLNLLPAIVVSSLVDACEAHPNLDAHEN